MKYKVEATQDIDGEYGGLPLSAKTGEKLELSVGDFEIAMRTGAFKRVEEVPETEGEQQSSDAENESREAKKAELLKLSKEDLLERGGERVKPSMTKDEIADEILNAESVVADINLTPETEEK